MAMDARRRHHVATLPHRHGGDHFRATGWLHELGDAGGGLLWRISLGFAWCASFRWSGGIGTVPELVESISMCNTFACGYDPADPIADAQRAPDRNAAHERPFVGHSWFTSTPHHAEYAAFWRQ